MCVCNVYGVHLYVCKCMCMHKSVCACVQYYGAGSHDFNTGHIIGS